MNFFSKSTHVMKYRSFPELYCSKLKTCLIFLSYTQLPKLPSQFTPEIDDRIEVDKKKQKFTKPRPPNVSVPTCHGKHGNNEKVVCLF